VVKNGFKVSPWYYTLTVASKTLEMAFQGTKIKKKNSGSIPPAKLTFTN
jgi:hypothetical protein